MHVHSLTMATVALRSEKEVAELMRTSVDHFGAVDVLVLNHGIFPPGDVPSNRFPLAAG